MKHSIKPRSLGVQRKEGSGECYTLRVPEICLLRFRQILHQLTKLSSHVLGELLHSEGQELQSNCEEPLAQVVASTKCLHRKVKTLEDIS